MIAFVTLFLLFLFTFNYMTYYLGKRQLIEYSIGMLTKYVDIPLTFYRQTQNSGRRYIFNIYVSSFILLVLLGIATKIINKR